MKVVDLRKGRELRGVQHSGKISWRERKLLAYSGKKKELQGWRSRREAWDCSAAYGTNSKTG